MIRKLLIANRGEIAVRIARTAAEMGIATVAVYSADDALSLHVRRADAAVKLAGAGPQAYLDVAGIVAAAQSSGCDAVHPGYGFLSENVAFARAVEQAGLIFVGPTADSLALYGNKVAARKLADDHGVPIVPGTLGPTDTAGAEAFFATLPKGASMIVKAVSGGGGRGMRVVSRRAEVADAVAKCTTEALAAFGSGKVYVERCLPDVRHLEVQVLGDGQGHCMTLGERDCTLQRRHQKLIEIAPAPNLPDSTRTTLARYALTLANASHYRSLGTFEFLMNAKTGALFFIEANPRIQVEHTITEAVFSTDLVAHQLHIAGGATLAELAIDPTPHGFAIQMRVNMERMAANGDIQATGGVITAYDPPGGAGVRVDGFAYAGYQTLTAFDGLLAKVIVQSADFAHILTKADRALAEFRIEGLDTNISYLRALLQCPELQAGNVSTRFVEMNAASLAKAAADQTAPLFFASAAGDAVQNDAVIVPDTLLALRAPMLATVMAVNVQLGDRVDTGQELAVLVAMKMEHPITAPHPGIIREIYAQAGDMVNDGAPIFALEGIMGGADIVQPEEDIDLDAIRPDLQEFYDRRAFGLDESRPEALAKRHARGQRMARENLADLCDAGTFNEYGEFAVAAQSRRRSYEDLLRNTSGDGIITGTGTINGNIFETDAARCAFAIADYSVLAGTQGVRHHEKLDRIFKLARDMKTPLVMLAEGGGGRPGDTDHSAIAGLDIKSFRLLAGLSGQVPLVGVASGRCFAGNAALLGCCDVIIATENSNIGMAGPAMIEGGGLGSYHPEEIGPIDVQTANGVVDIRVADEAAACAIAKKYLSFFQGPITDWSAPDQRLLRRAVPENRLRAYEVRDIIAILADTESVLELRAGFGTGIVTALIRIEGKPYGLIANNSKFLGGAIDADAADKASRFMRLCNAHGLPIVSLCDTPGFIVGPEAESTALVRHICRMFVTGASLRVPVFAIVLRKGYGLGAQAMTAGGFHAGTFSISWPTGEFGGMGLEGAVRLGFRKELDAIADETEKQALFDRLVAKHYAIGKAVFYASALEIDAVIDPQDTRRWIVNGTAAQPPEGQRGTGQTFIDTW